MSKSTNQGLSAPAIAERLQIHAQTVRTWIIRFNISGVAGLADRDRSGRPATYTPEQVAFYKSSTA